MDRLEHQIDIKQRDLEEARSRVLRLEIEIAALLDAAKLRPKKVSDTSEGPKLKFFSVKGKPQGAVSLSWQKVLGAIVRDGNVGVSSRRILKLATDEGLNTTLPSVRERLRKYRTNGYLRYFKDTGYFVTDEAIEKFGLRKK